MLPSMPSISALSVARGCLSLCRLIVTMTFISALCRMILGRMSSVNAILRYMLQGMRSARCMRSVCSNVSFLRVADTMFVICALGDQLVVIQCYAVQSCSVLMIAVVWQIAIPVLWSLVNTNEELRHSRVAKSLCSCSTFLYYACMAVFFVLCIVSR